jgi:histidinol-phosphate aminotransferase
VTADVLPAPEGAAVTLDQLPLRDDLRGKTPYGAPQLDVAVRLNTNENPYPPPPELVADVTAAVAEVAAELHRYPDRDARALRADLAAYLTAATGVPLDAAAVWAANGSNEVLQQVLQAFGGPGRLAVGFEPSYSMHPIIAGGTRTEWLPAPRRTDFAIDVDAAAELLHAKAPDVTFLTSPNNPTGQSLEPADLARLIDAAPGIVVVDEAYAEFSDRPSAITLLATHGHKLIVSRTMSKAFRVRGRAAGLPGRGARRGRRAAARAPALPPVGAHPGRGAGGAAARRRDARFGGAPAGRTGARGNGTGHRRIYGCAQRRQLRALRALRRRAGAWRAFLDLGVLIRDVGIPKHLRVTIGTPEENDAFLQAAVDVLKQEAMV